MFAACWSAGLCRSGARPGPVCVAGAPVAGWVPVGPVAGVGIEGPPIGGWELASVAGGAGCGGAGAVDGWSDPPGVAGARRAGASVGVAPALPPVDDCGCDAEGGAGAAVGWLPPELPLDEELDVGALCPGVDAAPLPPFDEPDEPEVSW